MVASIGFMHKAPHGERRIVATALCCLLFLLCLPSNTFAQQSKRIVFLGDSLTAGYQLLADDAYPALVHELAKARGYSLEVVNGGMSGDTSGGALRRLPWLLNKPAQILFIAIGANDGLRGLSVDELEKNLRAIIERARIADPSMQIMLAGIKLPRHIGGEYGEKFEAVYPRVAREMNVLFMPFLLKGVAGNSELNLPDGIHPSGDGHKVIASNVWKELEPILGKNEP